MFINELCFKLLSAIIICLLAGCIILAPVRGNTDGFESFSETNLASNISFVEIDLDNLLQHDFEDIYLFATWCPACIVHLRTIPSKTTKSESKAVYVSTNYYIKSIEKFAAGKLDTVFILSNKEYGSIESDKIIKFTSEVLNKEAESTGLPQVFSRIGQSQFELKPANKVRAD